VDRFLANGNIKRQKLQGEVKRRSCKRQFATRSKSAAQKGGKVRLEKGEKKNKGVVEKSHGSSNEKIGGKTATRNAGGDCLIGE